MIHTEDFSIQFKHGRNDNGDRYTKCVISTINPATDGLTSLSVAYAICSKDDNFCKKTGRLLSFNRARRLIDDKVSRMSITKSFNVREGYPFND